MVVVYTLNYWVVYRIEIIESDKNYPTHLVYLTIMENEHDLLLVVFSYFLIIKYPHYLFFSLYILLKTLMKVYWTQRSPFTQVERLEQTWGLGGWRMVWKEVMGSVFDTKLVHRLGDGGRREESFEEGRAGTCIICVGIRDWVIRVSGEEVSSRKNRTILRVVTD